MKYKGAAESLGAAAGICLDLDSLASGSGGLLVRGLLDQLSIESGSLGLIFMGMVLKYFRTSRPLSSANEFIKPRTAVEQQS